MVNAVTSCVAPKWQHESNHLSQQYIYTLLWSNGATTQDLTALNAGTYTMVLRNQRLYHYPIVRNHLYDQSTTGKHHCYARPMYDCQWIYWFKHHHRHEPHLSLVQWRYYPKLSQYSCRILCRNHHRWTGLSGCSRYGHHGIFFSLGGGSDGAKHKLYQSQWCHLHHLPVAKCLPGGYGQMVKPQQI